MSRPFKGRIIDTPGTSVAEAEARGERGRSLYRLRLLKMSGVQIEIQKRTHAATQPIIPTVHRMIYHTTLADARVSLRTSRGWGSEAMVELAGTMSISSFRLAGAALAGEWRRAEPWQACRPLPCVKVEDKCRSPSVAVQPPKAAATSGSGASQSDDTRS